MRSAYGLDSGPDLNWRTSAACGPDTAELFFVSEGNHAGRAGLTPNNRKALAICARCPVRQECHDDARTSPSPVAHIAGGAAWPPNHNRRDQARQRATKETR